MGKTNEIAYLEKGESSSVCSTVADGVGCAFWHDSSATDFCGYFDELPYNKGGG
jgi:hypothetical protein